MISADAVSGHSSGKAHKSIAELYRLAMLLIVLISAALHEVVHA